MKYFFIPIFVFLLILMSCYDHNRIPEGTYYGTLPCADCPGIYYQLTLKKDNTYDEKIFYIDRNMNPVESEGKFKVEGNKIILLNKESEGINQFLITNSKLQMLDKAGKPIKSEFAEDYFLRNEKPKDFNMPEKITIIKADFTAQGNEPFWSLQIEVNHLVKFRAITAEQIELTLPIIESKKSKDGETITYRAENDEGEVEVTIFNTRCTDILSGDDYNNGVFVKVKTREMLDFREFEGCGEYIGKYRLNDNWALKELNGKVVKWEKLEKVPRIEFHLSEHRVFGNGGCNTFQGNLMLFPDSIKIGPLATTLKACPDLQLEQKFFEAISENKLNFKILDGELVLENDSTLLVLTKTD